MNPALYDKLDLDLLMLHISRRLVPALARLYDPYIIEVNPEGGYIVEAPRLGLVANEIIKAAEDRMWARWSEVCPF